MYFYGSTAYRVPIALLVYFATPRINQGTAANKVEVEQVRSVLHSIQQPCRLGRVGAVAREATIECQTLYQYIENSSIDM